MSNIESTKDGLVEKSSGRKIVSPLDIIFEQAKIRAKETIKGLVAQGMTMKEIDNIAAEMNRIISMPCKYPDADDIGNFLSECENLSVSAPVSI